MNDQALTKTLDILKELISFETVALTSNLDLITYAEKYLSDLGAKVSLTHSPDGERANLFASFAPEINGGIIDDLKQPTLIANPNCTTMGLVMALKPLHDKFDLKSITSQGLGRAESRTSPTPKDRAELI